MLPAHEELLERSSCSPDAVARRHKAFEFSIVPEQICREEVIDMCFEHKQRKV